MLDHSRTTATDRLPILVVDDDEVCIMAIRRVAAKKRRRGPIHTAKDGIEGLELLKGVDGGTLSPPFVVLLDINMPRMNGLEFLAELRRDPKLRRSIVFVLTTSDAPSDVRAAYDNNVAGYIVKGDLVETFQQTLDLIDQYARLVVIPN